MVYEFRTYKVAEGRMEELVKRFQLHTLRLFEKHGINPVVFLGISESNPNKFSYVVSFPDCDEQTKRWKSFINDQERIEIWYKSNKNGKLVTSM